MRRRKIQAAPRGHGIIARRLSACSTCARKTFLLCATS